VRHSVQAKGRWIPTIGVETAAPAVVTGGGWWGGGGGGGGGGGCAHDGGRLADRRLLCHQGFQFPGL